MPKSQGRIMRVVIPVSLIREMDVLILEGAGGFETRGEFIVDAITERIAELTVSQEEHVGRPDPFPGSMKQRKASGWEDLSEPTPTAVPRETLLHLTGIQAPDGGRAVDANRWSGDRQPLFGLHNTDYPSLWALARLATLAEEEPVALEAFLRRVLHDAWGFGRRLRHIEEQYGFKCTALFPTNPEKPKAASSAFKVHAIDPLHKWQVVGTTGGDLIGVTHSGWNLLSSVAGLTVARPHPEEMANGFLRHLRTYSPGDWSGFACLLKAINLRGARRTDVVNHFAAAWPDWTANQLSTNAAGYISRAREWGLVEGKQRNRLYHLTDFGATFLKEERGRL